MTFRYFLHELILGLRLARKTPGLSLLAVAVLTLGIGAVATHFAIMQAFLFRPLPFPGAERVMAVSIISPAEDNYKLGVPYEALQKWRQRLDEFGLDALGGGYTGTVNMGDVTETRRYDGSYISWDFLRLTGNEPLRGRGFTAADARADEVAILLSERTWRADYRANPATVGRVVQVNGKRGRIVGILPEQESFPSRPDVWVVLSDKLPPESQTVLPWLNIVARLSPGVSPTEAAARLQAELPPVAIGSLQGAGVANQIRVEPLIDALFPPADRVLLYLMLAATGCLLLISCANVANLLLARASVRSRDIAIRLALGAGRRHILAQSLSESAVLAVLGAVGGIVLMYWQVELVAEFIGRMELPFWFRLEVDALTLGVALGAALVAGLLAGLAPASQTGSTSLYETMKEGARGVTNVRTGRLTRSLVGVQVALSGLLVVVALAMMHNLQLLNEVRLPLPAERILGARVALFPESYPDRAARMGYLNGVISELRQTPGIIGATATSRLRFSAVDKLKVVAEGGDPKAGVSAAVETVASNYFEVMQAPLLAGGTFSAQPLGTGDPSEVVINEILATRLFGTVKVVGREIELSDPMPSDGAEASARRLRIVGVAPDLQMSNANEVEKSVPGLYLPLASVDFRFVSLLAVSQGPDAHLVIEPLRRALRTVDPNTPPYFVETARESFRMQTMSRERITTIFSSFALTSLLLAMAGVYGVVSFAVSLRTPEIGIRLALGARARDILGLLVDLNGPQLALGLSAGLALGVLITVGFPNMLAPLEIPGPWVLALAALVLIATAVLGAAWPARCALSIPPDLALRADT